MLRILKASLIIECTKKVSCVIFIFAIKNTLLIVHSTGSDLLDQIGELLAISVGSKILKPYEVNFA